MKKKKKKIRRLENKWMDLDQAFAETPLLGDECYLHYGDLDLVFKITCIETLIENGIEIIRFLRP